MASKILAFISTTTWIVVVIFVMFMVWETKDLSPLDNLIPTTAAAASTVLVFYFNKAKAENKIKLMKENNVQLENDDFDE